MKTRIGFLLAALLFTMSGPVLAQDEAAPFHGRWALHLPGGAGWLHVHENDGFLDAELLWYGGSVLPVSGVHVHGDMLTVTRQITVVRKRDDNNKPVRSHTLTNRLEVRRDGDGLKGVAIFPNRDGMGIREVAFTGTLTPDLPPAPGMDAITFGEAIELFNGMDLTGWSLVNPEQENGFMVEDGVLINNPVQPEDGHHISYGNLRTDQTFEDFNLTLEVNVPEGSNSGVYLRGIYEIQVMDSHGETLDSHHMGALYSRIVPSVAAEKPAGEWQTMDITLYQRHVTVLLNGTNIIDNQPVLGVTGGALTADEFLPGPIYLQGDHGRILYRNFVLTPIVN